MSGVLENIARFREGRSKRISSYDRAGGNADFIFRKSLRGSIEASHANAMTLDLATVAYWYQTEPHKPLAAMADRAGRRNMPEINECDIHRWRETWRQTMGGGALWGNEPLPKAFLSKLAKLGAPGRKALAPQGNTEIAEAELKAQEKMLDRRKRKK